MFIAYIVVASVLSLVLLGSARGKLVKDEKITKGMAQVGVPRPGCHGSPRWRSPVRSG